MLYFPSHTWQFVVYISFRLQKLDRKIEYCCIRWCSLVLSASSAVSAWFRTTYLAVRGIHITSCEIDHEHHVVEFMVSPYRTVFSSSKIKPEIWAQLYYVDVRSCFWHLLLFALIRITYLAVRGIHIISSSIIKPEHGVLLYTWMFARAFGIFCCFCLIWYHIPRSSSYTYYIMWDRSWTSCGWVPGIVIIRHSFFVFKY